MIKEKKYKIGLVLSGGGVRGFAHAGALKALNEAGIFPGIISGTSAGAIAGSLYADGKNGDEIMNMFSEKKLFKYLEIVIPKKGLLKMTGLTKIISQNLKAKTFEELTIPLIVTATNLNEGICKYFSSGELLKPILASSTVPVIFAPIKIDEKSFVDGGVLNNFPIEPVEKICDFIIGIHVNPFGYCEEFTSIMSIAERSFHLSFSSHMSKKINKCDIFIEPIGLEKFKLLDISKINEIFNLGYKETKRILSENQEKISLMLSL
ncbi:MAG TPA: patatin-like phospholipase family protein [Bacteroidales bacterium]|nr:patatin-like phospholipase family protein [Bacteroidales bacterium]HPS18397.1 patatin-like phospholipase family protein [Bacteroidales bacterium]